ncbi:fimbrial biogenesis chaperone [Yersinia frederiksenii]|uniref:fimbrial biogenesis chaperone n=1 Tax=Yersinia frederiksenii TaxID=29484 RepID=UPI0005DDF8EA|nr:molecular chaperone [Yersinia frederiksenii]CQJ04961.1 pili chaperone protein [Yersinia frederiksenii]
MKVTLNYYPPLIVVLMFFLWVSSSKAALVLDRTRIIYNEDIQSISVTLTNKSSLPYIAQSWIEDNKGKKIISPFMVLPPLQRVEANERNVIRVTLLPGNNLPTDRESVFYLNVREIPPKTDKQNALQIALHSKIKLFYRPSAVIPPRGENAAAKMQISIQGNQLNINNTTPLHITLVGVSIGESKSPLKLEPKMLEPGEKVTIPAGKPITGKITLSHMNDYGGQQETIFDCTATACVSNDKQRS